MLKTSGLIVVLLFYLLGNNGHVTAQTLQDDDGPSLLEQDEGQPGLQPGPDQPSGLQPGTPDLQQPDAPQEPTRSYVIGGIEVEGNVGVSRGMILNMSGLQVGKSITVPGEDISNAIKNLWGQDLFSDVRISVEEIRNDQIFLLLEVQTMERLSGFELNGISRRSRRNSIKEELNLSQGDVVTNFLLSGIDRKITTYYYEKGYPDASVEIERRSDTLFDGHSVFLNIFVDRGPRVRIKDINFYGNEEFSGWRLRRTMDETKQRQRLNFFRNSKFLEDEYEADKKRIIQRYKREGFRDARIVEDSVYRTEDDLINIDIHIEEGDRYYFGDITWTGNTKYDNKTLSAVMGIEKGDVYNPERLFRRLHGDMGGGGRDVSSLYMDDGHLFFNATPTELKVDNNHVDVQVQIREGPQAVINEVTFSGNTKTNDHVILREIRTRPGKKFSRSDVVRSQRELAQLGYFDPEKMEVIPTPNPEDGTVDIEYKLVETESDQVELSGGYGQNQLVFTLGLEFNNFSVRNITNTDAWRPLPTGDGQRLRLRAQSNGRFFQSYNFSFTEPWFGGSKPNSFNFSLFHSVQSNGVRRGEPDREDIRITGLTVGLTKRLTIPDDFFTLSNTVTIQRYNLNNFSTIFAFREGTSNNLNFKHQLTRNSIDAPIYPRRGSRVSLSFQWTPPYSLFDDRDQQDLTPQEQFKWLEYHKTKFETSWFFNITDRLVLNARSEMGLLGRFNSQRDISPFERFYVGGDGLSGFNLDGRELIRLRGYDDNIITPRVQGNRVGGNVFSKFTFELRYPVSLNPNATVYLLAFAEGGNNWLGIQNFDPFDLHRSVGGGIRVFLPMFGMLGFDMGYGLDNVDYQPGEQQHRWHPHISIGQQF